MNRAVFLDRDGTVIVDRGYLADHGQGVELLPGAGEALARLSKAGFQLVIISNQSGVGRGLCDQTAVTAQNRRLRELLAEFQVEPAAEKFCPHTPEDKCRCRKPSPEMLLQAARELDIDLTRSYMVGDKESDVEAGQRAGCRTVLLGQNHDSAADWQAADLTRATNCILAPPYTTAVIPARYASTRFPGKPLARIAGKPMIQWVCERVGESRLVQETLVATDDRRIAEAVRAFGGQAVITKTEHQTGTDRIAEAIQERRGDLILNVQGDEPMLRGASLDRLVQQMVARQSDMGTIAIPFDKCNENPEDPNLVKVVIDANGYALYFSRSLIPRRREGGDKITPLLHWGVYAYRRKLLEKFVKWPQSRLERCEMLEQLRALENGVRIMVLLAEHPVIGVDRPEDVQKIERMLESRGITVRRKHEVPKREGSTKHPSTQDRRNDETPKYPRSKEARNTQVPKIGGSTK